MRRLFLPALPLLGLLFLSPAVLAKGSAPPGVDRDEVVYIADRVLCDCGCHPQSVYSCSCGRAEEMWDELGLLVQARGSGKAALAAYVAEHGEKVLVVPKAVGFNLLAWLGPLTGLLLATAGMLLVLKRWSRSRGSRPEPDRKTPKKLDPDYLARLNRDLEEME